MRPVLKERLAAVGLLLAGLGFIEAWRVAGSDAFGLTWLALAAGLLVAAYGALGLPSPNRRLVTAGGLLFAALAGTTILLLSFEDGSAPYQLAHGLIAVGTLLAGGSLLFPHRPGWGASSGGLILGAAGGLTYAALELGERYYAYQFADWLVVVGFGLGAFALRRIHHRERSARGPAPSYPRNYRLPDSMRSIFQEPFGPIVQTPDLPAQVRAEDTLVCVGDRVALTAIEAGLKPKIIVVDYQTERVPIGDLHRSVLTAYGRTVLRVLNPAATVTGELYGAVLQAFRLAGPVRIEVEGEEDLAGLPVFAESPPGTVVLYGMPKRGIVVVRLDEAMRSKARGLLERMRVPS